MNQIKHQDHVFADGANLWIIADLASSKWAQKLDWYLNFQLRRASLHKPKKISEANQEKIASWGIELSDYTKKKVDSKTTPLMIASRQLLPNQVTIQIPFQDVSVDAWSHACVKVLKELKATKARVFLPGEISPAAFTKAVNSKSGDSQFSFEVIEESALV